MIKILIYRDEEDSIMGFYAEGHAEFAESGNDVICAAVSAIVYNTINSIEAFTEDSFTLDMDEDRAFIDFKITSAVSSETKLLLNSLSLGLDAIQNDYGDEYISLKEIISN